MCGNNVGDSVALINASSPSTRMGTAFPSLFVARVSISTIGLAAVALLALVLGACGSSGSSGGADSGSGGDDAAPSLDGSQWVLTAMEPAVAGTDTVAVSAGFAAGVLSADANSFQPARVVSGQEAIEAIDRLERMASLPARRTAGRGTR